MRVKPASQVEIIRSNQKDEYYLARIREGLSEAAQAWLGSRTWIRWRKELDVLADLGYFCLTTIAGYQTLGEEYVNILQVDPTKRAVPSALRRCALAAFHVLVPYLLDRLLLYFEKQLRQNTSLQIRQEARSQLLELIPFARHLITVLHRCHLAVFYLKGLFYHIAKRFTGIQYILVRPDVEADKGINYSMLGWLSVIQLTLTFGQQVFKVIQKKKQTNQQSAPAVSSSSSSRQDSLLPVSASQKCPLCLEARNQSTATPCGHLFCWSCITEWCESKPQCPLCREPLSMSRLIYLQNFDPD